MFPPLTVGLHLLLAALGPIAGSEVPSLGALGVAVAVVSAVAVLASVLMLSLPSDGPVSPVHPARAIDISSPLSQSDPDASGHSRPRAPGFAASAA